MFFWPINQEKHDHSGFAFHLNDKVTALINVMLALRNDLKSIFRNDLSFLSQGLALQEYLHAQVKVAMVSPITIMNFS